MTTPQAEAQYLADHLFQYNGRPVTIYNPLNLPLEQLPKIYGFNNGGHSGWYEAVSLSEDGVGLGGHICSHEGYMPHDLGILLGSREDRHLNSYRVHYPNGYRMEFVDTDNISQHEGLQKAIAASKAKAGA